MGVPRIASRGVTEGHGIPEAGRSQDVDLHVAILPSFYPHRDERTRGTFFRDQAQALARAGARVGVICPHLAPLRGTGVRWFGRLGFRFEEADDEGVPTLRVYGANPPRAPYLSMAAHVAQWTRLMRRYVRRYGVPDLLHAHTAEWAGEAARRLAARHGLPYVVTEHSTHFALNQVGTWQRRRIRAVFEDADAVIAVSRDLAGTLERQFGLDPVHVVPNAIDTSFLTLAPRPRPGPGFTFLSLSYLIPRKGMDLLIAAFASAFAGRPDVRLHIGGHGAQRPYLERRTRELNVAGQVAFLGELSRDGVRDALANADCFALASHAETFGVVYAEAMASGMPVVATRCGGPEEFVGPRNGLLVEPANQDQLVAALRYMRDHACSYDPHAIRAEVERRFGRAAVAKQLLRLYEETRQAAHARSA